MDYLQCHPILWFGVTHQDPKALQLPRHPTKIRKSVLWNPTHGYVSENCKFSHILPKINVRRGNLLSLCIQKENLIIVKQNEKPISVGLETGHGKMWPVIQLGNATTITIIDTGM